MCVIILSFELTWCHFTHPWMGNLTLTLKPTCINYYWLISRLDIMDSHYRHVNLFSIILLTWHGTLTSVLMDTNHYWLIFMLDILGFWTCGVNLAWGRLRLIIMNSHYRHMLTWDGTLTSGLMDTNHYRLVYMLDILDFMTYVVSLDTNHYWLISMLDILDFCTCGTNLGWGRLRLIIVNSHTRHMLTWDETLSSGLMDTNHY